MKFTIYTYILKISKYMYGSVDSSFVPPMVYAIMGSSRDLAVGTVAVASLLTAAMLGKEVSAVENPKLYLHLAFTATFFAGLMQTCLGLLRLVNTPNPTYKHYLKNNNNTYIHEKYDVY